MELLYSGKHFTTHHNVILFDENCNFPSDLIDTEQYVYFTECLVVVTVDTDCDVDIAIYEGEGSFPDLNNVGTFEMFVSEGELKFSGKPGDDDVIIPFSSGNTKVSIYLDTKELYRAKKVVFLLRSQGNN